MTKQNFFKKTFWLLPLPTLIITFLVLFTKTVSACFGFLDCTNQGTGVSGFTAKNLVGEIFTKILPIVLGLAGMIAVVMIVISGFQFVTSSGNPESAAGARSRLTYALIGFVVVALAFAITQFVDKVFLNTSGIFR